MNDCNYCGAPSFAAHNPNCPSLKKHRRALKPVPPQVDKGEAV